jgi:hypothetical protein
MTAEELRAFAKADPFKPFRVVISDGRSFEVPYRTSMKVYGRDVMIYYVRPGDPPDAPWDTAQKLGLEVIEKVELIEPPVAV